VLVIFDTYTPWFEPVRNYLNRATYPLQLLSNMPIQIKEWFVLNTTSRSQLEEKNVSLEKERLILRGKLQRSADLAAENMRLRQLLNASELLIDSVLVTEVIGISPSPHNHTVTIDRGAEDNVYVGQPLLDATGLMGQVTHVFNSHSQVLLITDLNHALPVQVVRNGLRSIVEGTADYNEMRLRFVSPTTDIIEGDQLVSSGLGGRFPVGYPVGTVTEINHTRGEKFVDIKVKPSAQHDRSKHLLLVFTLQDGEISGKK
jgi:rod shape-determining protein MreC